PGYAARGLAIPSLLIIDCSVVRFIPSRSAAPRGPLAPSTAGHRDLPALACPSFLECYVLYAGGSSSALDQFFPDDIGLHLGYQGSAPRKWFHKRLHVGLSISARQTFLDVVALQVARLPWPFDTATQRPRASTFELSVDSSPPLQSNMQQAGQRMILGTEGRAFAESAMLDACGLLFTKEPSPDRLIGRHIRSTHEVIRPTGRIFGNQRERSAT